MSECEVIIWNKVAIVFGKYFGCIVSWDEVLNELEEYEIMVREQPTLGCGELKNKNSGV